MEVDQISVPAIDGYLGIMKSHAPLITILKEGIVTLFEKNKTPLHYFVSGGFLEVLDNTASILVEVVEKASEVDLERAQKAEERAQERLKNTSNMDLDIQRALASLQRAKARKRLVTMDKHHS